MAMTEEERAIRRERIKSRAISLRKSAAQTAAWQRRRAELQTFIDDEPGSADIESAGSPDHDLNELPEILGCG